MAIVSEGGRRGSSGSSSFGRRGQCHAAVGAGSSSAAAALLQLQYDEMEESDREVQSSFRGPFDTMDALQGALPNNRKGVSKFYNGKSSYMANVAHPAQSIANHGKPSPKKRKGFLSFTFSWNKSRSKGSSSSSSRRDATATTSSKNCRNKTVPPSSPTSSSHGNSRGVNEHARRWLQRRSSSARAVVSVSPPDAVRSQLIAVQLQSVSVAGLEDVAESTASICPREKRRKSLE